MIKGVVLLTLFWWGWFRADRDQSIARLHMLSTLFACFVAIILARAMALFLPFRDRPMHEDALAFTMPYSINDRVLQGWSSFPSDHAVLFYALAAGMFFISRRVGVFSLVYVTLMIAFPRVYLGLHYATDIMFGAFVGVVVILLCNTRYFLDKVSEPVLNWSNSRPEIFYPLFFILAYQIADMFDSSRALLKFFKTLFQAAVG